MQQIENYWMDLHFKFDVGQLDTLNPSGDYL